MSESGRVAWITRDPNGRAVGIHAARPAAPKGLTIEAHEWDTAFAIVRGEWLGEKADVACDHCKDAPPRGHTCPRCKAATP